MKHNISKNTVLKDRVVALLFLEFITVIIPVIVLGKYFNFPDILRQPASKAFELFKENQTEILIGYYIFLLSSLLYIPLSYCLVRLLFQSKSKTAKSTFIGLGITTALLQSIGFVRWIFTMPYLTQTYFENTTNKETIILIYETLNRYAGMSIGEHLGFISMGCWTICLGILLIKHPKINQYIGFTGLFIGFLLIASTLEHFGGILAASFGILNFIANTLWSIWLLVLALVLHKVITK